MWRLKTMASKAVLVLALFAVLGVASRFAKASGRSRARGGFSGCSCCLR